MSIGDTLFHVLLHAAYRTTLQRHLSQSPHSECLQEILSGWGNVRKEVKVFWEVFLRAMHCFKKIQSHRELTGFIELYSTNSVGC